MSGKQVTKKIINCPESCVDDSLRGVIANYPSLHLHPKHRVITVRHEKDSGRVAIIGGGGSGHEPFASGFIGAGMLDGAIAGGVFASPPTGHVLYAIAHSYKFNSGGVIVILGNYTGDRLNFGKAIEKAKIAGMKVEGLIVNEDVASRHNRTGGRSMVGEVLFYKLCGAMSVRGYAFEAIRDMVIQAYRSMATLGVGLSACSLPGQPPLFEIAHDEFEFGSGVHGEAGIKKVKMATAKEIVQMIIDEILPTLNLQNGDRVVVVLNNLGGTSFLEMNIISAETKDYLESKNITVERIFSGPMKTSLDMHGFQICILHLNDKYGDLWLELLDDPTTAIGWTGGVASISNGYRKDTHEDDTILNIFDGRKTTSGPRLSPYEQELLQGSLSRAAEELIKNEALMNRLDSGCGDGDCGMTLKKFGRGILSYLKTASLEYPSNVLWGLSEIAETNMGGTSGGIYSLGLSAASQAIGSASTNERSMWLAAWEKAIMAIRKYGGAEPGDRTLLDTLCPAAEAFKMNLTTDLKILLRKTAEAAENGAKETAQMTAKAGRASYVASDHLHGEDAGARGAVVWINAILTFIANYQ